MEWHDRMNAAIAYIEDNLTGKIDIWKAAQIAWCSEYHFRRMFSFIAGVSLSEYIRRRRLSLAAFDLHHHRAGVGKIAATYGYRSPDSFARAFSVMHGISPTEAMDEHAVYKSWPRITFYLTIKGGTQMNVRIEKKTGFKIIGLKKRVAIQFEGTNPEIEAMWRELSREDIQVLKDLSNVDPSGIIQASTDFDDGRMEEKGSLDQYIGVASTLEVPVQWSALEVSASLWAVFLATGPFPQTLQETWGRIYSEWFPSVEYELAEGPEILSIKEKDLTKDDVPCEIWIPVSKKR